MFSKKSFVAGLVAGCVLAGGSAVFAGQNINAIISGTHFKFNGVEKPLPEGFTSIGYNGHTYVPARFVAEQLGAQVGYDADTNTVTIESNPTNNQPTPQPTPVTPAQPTDPNPTNKITTIDELQAELEKNYSSLKTPMGTTNFTFTIDTNDSTMFPYDFWVQTEYNYLFYFDIEYSNKYSAAQKEQTKQAL